MKRFIIYLFGIFILSAHGFAQGLFFNSWESDIENRTSYHVFEKSPPIFSDHLSLRFNLSIRNFDSFGYIFQLTDDLTGTSYNFTFSNIDKNQSSLKFVVEEKEILIQVPLNNQKQNKEWIPIAFDFLLNQDAITLTIGGEVYKRENVGLKNTIKPSIYFGKTPTSVATPFIGLRNLVIEDKKTKYEFPLNEYKGEAVHDTQGNAIGKVSHPVWMINDSYYWKQRFTYISAHPVAVSFSEQMQKILLVDKDSLVKYDVLSNSSSSSFYKNERPIDVRLGTNFLDNTNSLCYVYELNNLPQDDVTIASLNLETLTWQTISKTYLLTQRHHHNGYFDAKDSKYYVFGGFGNQKYHNDFKCYDLQTDTWDTLLFEGDVISPRHFSALAIEDPNTAYLFGGIGNKIGDQSSGYFASYDFYKIDFKNRQINKLWNIQNKTHDFAPARDMHIDADGNNCYALCYPILSSHTYLKLYQFSIHDGSYSIVGDSIPITSTEIATNANLWYNKRLNEFYCTIEEFSIKGETTTTVYSLSSPPLTLYQLENMVVKKESDLLYPILGSITTLLCILFLGYHHYRKKNKHQPSDATHNNHALNISETDVLPHFATSNAIFLFGNFTVLNKSGKDISYMFGSKLKQLFVLLLVHNPTGGINSTSIYDALWADKPLQKAKNLKGVMLNNLRKIFADLHGIDLVYANNNYTLTFTDDMYCDYNKFSELTNTSNTAISLNKKSLAYMLGILNRGAFLNTIDDAYFDPFKHKVENEILTSIPLDLEKCFAAGMYHEVLLMTTILFHIDPLSEIAICYYIHAHKKLNSLDVAKKRYAKFIVTYRKSMNEEYQYSFDVLLEKSMLDSLKTEL